MRILLWPVLTLVLCMPLALVVFRYPFPWLAAADYADPIAVPEGDYEIAWFNATTAGNAWERFVTAAKRLEDSRGIRVDDSTAFPEQTTQVPEIVLTFPNQSARLRIRWYKLNLDDPKSIERWLGKLAARNPAPLAIIGGPSSDRARNVAIALERQTTWHGVRPLFFITNASAEEIQPLDRDIGDSSLGRMVPLMSLYPGRSFRFCFSNREITDAMLDFLKQTTTGGLPKLICTVEWKDDPYSIDLVTQFDREARNEKPPPRIAPFRMEHSIGGFALASDAEKKLAATILEVLQENPNGQAALVVPTVPGPARRLIKTLCDANPGLGERLIALNGDGMGPNTVLRDGQYLWPAASLPVPLVIFCHANPVAHDARLPPPSSTDDVLHAATMLERIVDAMQGQELAADAEELAKRLHHQKDHFFDAEGNRAPGTDEFMLVCKPVRNREGLFVPSHEVWQRGRDRRWVKLGAAP